jgi:hypothetical protein
MGSLSYMLKCPDLCGVYDPGKEEKKIYMVNFYYLMFSMMKKHAQLCNVLLCRVTNMHIITTQNSTMPQSMKNLSGL